MTLSDKDQEIVTHWRRWVASGGRHLIVAGPALSQLLAIIDKLTKDNA